MKNGKILQLENGIRSNLLSVIVVMTALVSGILLFSPNIISLNQSILVMAQTDDSISSSFSLSNLIEQGSPYIGNLSAPITIVDFSDFQCHLCARHVKNTEPLINETYIQTGQVALVFKHLPNRGFDSMGAHIAAQCTNDQGKFWQFYKLLYENQQAIDSGWVSKDNLNKFASQISGLEKDQFNTCFDSQTYKEFIDNDVKLAHSQGLFDTPSFIVVDSTDGSDPEIIRGAQPFPAFQSVIEKKLDELKE
ncbi:MAG: thioredoxin domain-containing protein [Nitrososphaeraceae archaeon]